MRCALRNNVGTVKWLYELQVIERRVLKNQSAHYIYCDLLWFVGAITVVEVIQR